MSSNDISYGDESERLYGATGMSLALVVCGANELLRATSVDSEPMLDLAPEFYMCGAEGRLASTVHRHVMRNYRLAVSMTLGNIMCRDMVLHSGRLQPAHRDAVLSAAVRDADADLGLEPDEAREIFDSEYARLDRVFAHPGVHKAVRAVADRLRERRTLSRVELLETLHAMGLL